MYTRRQYQMLRFTNACNRTVMNTCCGAAWTCSFPPDPDRNLSCPSIVISIDAYEHPARDAAPVTPQVVFRSLFPLLSQSARHASRLGKMPRPFGGTHFMHLALHGMQPVLVVATACGMPDIGYLPAATADPNGIARKTRAPAVHRLKYFMRVPHE